MWLHDHGSPQRVISLTISGGHMSWMAAMAGAIIHDWNLDGVLLSDGSSHGINDRTYHYSWELNGRPDSFNPKNFKQYLDSCQPLYGSPTIHYEGIPTITQGKQWNEILDYIGDLDDVLIIPTITANLQEAIYCMLNIATKSVKEDKVFLQIVSGVNDVDESKLDEVSKTLLKNWLIMSGVDIKNKPKQSFTIHDIITNNAFTIMAKELCRIFDKKMSDNQISMINAYHKKMIRLNSLNWHLSESLVKNRPDDAILTLKPNSLILKALNMALRL